MLKPGKLYDFIQLEGLPVCDWPV